MTVDRLPSTIRRHKKAEAQKLLIFDLPRKKEIKPFIYLLKVMTFK